MKKQNRAEFAPQLKVEEFPPTSSFEPAETPRKPEEEVDNSGSEYTQGDETMDMAILQELIKDDEKSLELFIRDNDKAVDYITQGDLPNALSMLEKMEKLMEYIAMNGRVLDRNIIIVCLYNIASAYQASWQLAKCAKYIEAVTYNIAQSIIHDEAVINAKAPKNYEDPQINGLRAITLRKKQFLVKVYLQYCAVASQLNKHDEALAIGHKAHGVMCSIIEQCLEFCQEVNKSIELDTKSLVSPQKANDRSRVTTSGSSSDLKKNMLSEITFRDEIYYNKHIVDSAMPFLEDFLKNTQEFSRVKMDEIVRTTRNLLFNWKNNPENNEKYMRKELSRDKMPIQVADENRSLLGVQHDPEWLTTLNIGSIMHMRPLRYKDYSQKRELINELTKTSLQEKAVFQSLSFFTLATEMRFVEANKDPLPQTEGDTKSKEKPRVPGTYKISEAYHLKSVEVICRYITGPCPYINHLITSYQKHYGQDLETILEESMHSFNDSTVSKDLVIEDQLRITPGKMEAVIRDPVNRLQLVSKKPIKKANSSQERPKPALSERSEFVRNMEAERYKELKKDRKKETIKSVNIRGKKLSGKDANTNRLHTNSLSVSSPTRNSNIEFTMVSPKLHKTIMRCETDSDSVEDKLSGKKSPMVPTLGLNTILLKEVASPTLSKKASQGSSNGNTGFRSERGPPHHKPEPMSSFNASETERRSKELLQSEPTFYMHKNFNKFIQNYYIKTEQALQQRIVEEKIKEKFMKHPFQKEISPQKAKRLLTKKPNSSQMVSPPQPRTPLPGKTFDLSPLKKSLPGDLMKKIENKRPKTANKRGPSNESGATSHIRGNSANLRLSEKLMKALNTKEADYIKRNGMKK